LPAEPKKKGYEPFHSYQEALQSLILTIKQARTLLYGCELLHCADKNDDEILQISLIASPSKSPFNFQYFNTANMQLDFETAK